MADLIRQSVGHVRLVYWQPFLGAIPQVIVSRHPGQVDQRVGVAIWERLALHPRGDDDAKFIGQQSPPSTWAGLDDAQQFIQAAIRRPGGPVVVSAEVFFDDIAPAVDHELLVAVYATDEDLASSTHVIAGIDRVEVEHRLVSQLLPFAGDARLVPVSLDDPGSVASWLADNRGQLPGVAYSIQQTRLPAAAPVDLPVMVARQAWVAAVYWDGLDPDEQPEFIVNWTKPALERDFAELMYREFTQRLDEPLVARFVNSHTSPADWLTPADVSGWLEAMYVSSPGTAFIYQQVNLTPSLDGVTPVAAAAILTGNPFEAVLLADTDLAALQQVVANRLVEELDELPQDRRPDDFINMWGMVPQDQVGVGRWLEAYQNRVNYPAIAWATTQLPPIIPDEPDTAPAELWSAAAGPAAVRVRDLWAGLIEWDSLGGDNQQIWVGTNYASLAQTMVRILVDSIQSGNVASYQIDQARRFLENQPLNLDDQGSIDTWLDHFEQTFHDPAILIRPVYDASDELILPPRPDGITAATQTVVEPIYVQTPPVSSKPPADRQSMAGQMMVGVIRWGDHNDQPDVVMGTNLAQLRRQAADQIYTKLSSPAHGQLSGVGDPAGLDDSGVQGWLDRLTGVNGHLVFTVHEHVQATQLSQAITQATTQSVLNLLEPASNNLSAGQVMIRTSRPVDWAALSEGGIPDLLIDNFPPVPTVKDSASRYDDDLEDWMEHTLDLAIHISQAPHLEHKLNQLEHILDQLARHLETSPLPPQPRPDQYLTLPSSQVDDVTYRWAHQNWRHQFDTAARSRDELLTKLLHQTHPEQPPTNTAPRPANTPNQPEPSQATSHTRSDVTVSIRFNTDRSTLPGGYPFTPPGAIGSPSLGF